MGDCGFLRRLSVQVCTPGLYGDLVTYSARVSEVDEMDGVVNIDITGVNQKGEVSTAGRAEFELLRRATDKSRQRGMERE